MTQSKPVFHAGEKQIQHKFGVADRALKAATHSYQSGLKPSQVALIERLPIVWLSLLDIQERVWTVPVASNYDFISIPQADQLVLRCAVPIKRALGLDIVSPAPIAILALDFETRNRWRLNGYILDIAGPQLNIQIDVCYVNCPKYITARDITVTEETLIKPHQQIEFGPKITEQTARFIKQCDTLFISSRSQDTSQLPNGLDVSHRAGPAGFVRVLDEKHIEFDDYVGNNFFNTYGNIAVDGRVGIWIVNFEQKLGTLLTGIATIKDTDNAKELYQRPQRLNIEIDEIVISPMELNLNSDIIQQSPVF